MYAAIGTVIHVAREHFTRFVGIGAFDYEDQFIAHVLMAGQLSARCEAYENRAAPGFLVLPNRFLLNSRHRVGPGNFAEIKVLGGGRTSTITRSFNSAG